jgi:hypothetical protein
MTRLQAVRASTYLQLKEGDGGEGYKTKYFLLLCKILNPLKPVNQSAPAALARRASFNKLNKPELD